MNTVYTALVFPLLLLIGQTLVALGQRRLNMRMDEGEAKRNQAKADTDAKRAAEAKWREDMERRIAELEAAMDAVLKGQTTQMRSDLVHRAHRYLDDLGKASSEEKDAFWDQYKDYCIICKEFGIENSFIDQLAQRVMALPERDV